MDFPILIDLVKALEASALGEAMRGGANWYPLVNVAHLFGLVLLVGSIGVLDLRIAGLGKGVAVAPLSRFLTPFAAAGLLILLVSGFLLFAADAGPLFQSNVFRLKLALAAVALSNALVFRRAFGDLTRDPSNLAKVMALVSICLWLAVAALGRLIAYS